MSEETKQPTEETPETQAGPETETSQTEETVEKAEKAAKGKKKKEKSYTFTREQVEQMELAAKQLESVKDQFVRQTAEYENYRKRTTKDNQARLDVELCADGRLEPFRDLDSVADEQPQEQRPESIFQIAVEGKLGRKQTDHADKQEDRGKSRNELQDLLALTLRSKGEQETKRPEGHRELSEQSPGKDIQEALRLRRIREFLIEPNN